MTTNEYKAAETIIEEIMRYNDTRDEDDLRDLFSEAAAQYASDRNTYYSQSAEIIDNASGTDINYAECEFEGIYGENIYADCLTYSDVQNRLGFMLVYQGVMEHCDDVIEEALEGEE